MAASRIVTISIGIKLKVQSFTTTSLNYILVFTMVSPAISNLDTDSMRPAGRPFQSRCWPADWRPTMRMDGGDQGLSIEPSFATYG